MTTAAMITGASGGIGYEVARLLVRSGHNVVLVARDTPRLQGAASRLREEGPVTVVALATDLAQPGSVADLIQQLDIKGIEIDVLVNNAAYGVFGPFATNDLSEEQGLLQLNIVALTELTRALLPGMVERKQGRILNVGSTASFMPGGPLMATYYASKAYVLSFSRALATELQGSGVTVTALCPGPTWSGFQARAGIQDIRMLSGFVMTAEKVAQAGYAGLMQGKPLVIPGWFNRLVYVAGRLAPSDWLLRSVWLAQQRRRRRTGATP